MSTFDEWQEHKWLRALDPSSAPAFSRDLFSGLDLVIGTAFHSVVFAVQAGIPVIAISYDSKVSRFMAGLGLDAFALSPEAVQELPSTYRRLVEHHEAIRQHIQVSRERLVRESQGMFDAIRPLVVRRSRRTARRAEKISVIVVDDGCLENLKATLVSCRDQTNGVPETILVTSETSLDPTGEEKVVWVPPQTGLAASVNAGLACATGHYLTWIESGDHFMLDALDVLRAKLESSGAEAVYSSYYTLNNGKIRTHEIAHPPYKLMRHDVTSPCFLYRRDVHETIGPYDEDSLLPLYDFWLRCETNNRLVPIQTPLLFSRTRHGKNNAASAVDVRRKHYLGLPLLQRVLWRAANSSLASRLLRSLRNAQLRLPGSNPSR
jgi:hypothetical protein